jgi:hypothetical protein
MMPEFNALVARDTLLVARDTSLDARGTFSAETMPQLAAPLVRGVEFAALFARGTEFTLFVVYETLDA